MVLLATTPAVHRDNAADGRAERADGVHKESLVSRSDKNGQVAENRLVQPIFQEGRIFAASITSAQYRASTSRTLLGFPLLTTFLKETWI